MAIKSVIEIDVLDEKFQEFLTAFEQYKQAVEKMPKDWQKINEQTKKTSLDSEKAVKGHTKSLKDYMKAIDDSNESLKLTQKITTVISGNMNNISSIAGKFLSLFGTEGALASLALGIAGGAITSTVEDVTEKRRQAAGLGLKDTAELRAAEIAFKRFGDVSADLSKIADLQTKLSPYLQQMVGRENIGKDAAQLYPIIVQKFLEDVKKQGIDVNTQQGLQRLQVLSAVKGYGQVLPLDEQLRILKLQKEFPETVERYKQLVPAVGLTPEEEKRAQTIETTISTFFTTLKVAVERKILQAFTPSKLGIAEYIFAPLIKILSELVDALRKAFGQVAQTNKVLNPTGSEPITSAQQKSNKQQIIDFLTSKGFTKAQIAGVLGNFYAESGYNPNALQKGGEGVGLAQWDTARQKEFESLFGHPLKGSTLQEQLQFFLYELSHKEAMAGEALKKAATPTEASKVITQQYERPANMGYETYKREMYSNAISVNINNNTGGNATASAVGMATVGNP
jgi:hypothetical protein